MFQGKGGKQGLHPEVLAIGWKGEDIAWTRVTVE